MSRSAAPTRSNEVLSPAERAAQAERRRQLRAQRRAALARRGADPRARPADTDHDVSPVIPPRLATSAWFSAIWTGFGAAVLGCFVAVAIALLVWIPDASSTGTSGSTVRAGVLTFLAAQHGGIRLDGTPVRFIPLGLCLIAVWLCWRSARTLLGLPVIDDDISIERLAGLVGVQCAAYLLTCEALVSFARLGSTSIPRLGLAGGALLVSILGFGASTLRYAPHGLRLWRSLPQLARTSARAAVAAVAVVLGSSALLVMVVTVREAGRFAHLSRSLSAGISGLPVALLEALAAPNAVLAGTSYLAGPGFVVGTHSSYSAFAVTSGAVPGFPILAGLPSDRGGFAVITLLVVTWVGAGSAAGILIRRDDPGAGWWVMLGRCLGASVVAALLLGLLTALSGGGLGSRHLSVVGASPWQVTAAVLVEVFLVSSVAMGLSRLRSVTERADSPARKALKLIDVGRHPLPETPVVGAEPIEEHEITVDEIAADCTPTEAADIADEPDIAAEPAPQDEAAAS